VIPIEVPQTPWHYTTFWDWVDHWQTGLPGRAQFLSGEIGAPLRRGADGE
jgi:hypothetical protein